MEFLLDLVVFSEYCLWGTLLAQLASSYFGASRPTMVEVVVRHISEYNYWYRHTPILPASPGLVSFFKSFLWAYTLGPSPRCWSHSTSVSSWGGRVGVLGGREKRSVVFLGVRFFR